jgi:hypothetical protein
MKIHEIPFNNFNTSEEVAKFAGISDLDEVRSHRIQIPIENRRLAYFDVQRFEHPTWAFTSSCVQFAGWDKPQFNHFKLLWE